MNLNFEVVPSRTDSGPQVTARVRAISSEFRGAIRVLIEDAIAEGLRTARAEAPRGPLFQGHEGQRIADSIIASPVRYHPGGSGGGGFYEADLMATAEIAPHLRWVFEGTGERGEVPLGKIFPARGNVMAIQKEGEKVSFVRWTRGQFPQQRWWQDAQFRVDEVLGAGIRDLPIQ